MKLLIRKEEKDMQDWKKKKKNICSYNQSGKAPLKW